jgi:serine/threonine-protein kinase
MLSADWSLAMAPDAELLFGMLALQVGLIDQGQLVAAFQAWTRDKARPLAQHLVARGDLDAEQRAGVEAMVALHLRKHGTAERSLAAIPAGRSAREGLAHIGDPDLGASLAVLAPDADELALDPTPDPASAHSRITLAETEPDDGLTLAPAAVVPLDGSAARYQLIGEIARGGMGAVLRARDPGLGRDLALKMLLDRHRQRPDLIDRFVEEAQICGQLQHPGVVPVYELGALGDRRPFFTMKLVKGRTLAALLNERESPGDELPRFLSIFEAVCQTVAYAHARGVIHRDLKPSNVMVGSFGEVQVMDWGLAKVLRRDGERPRAEQPAPNETVVATQRSSGDSELSQAGSVLGTPAYMAPEQARGETDRVDRRADVFALGSILSEVLTGEPAFTGSSAREILAAAGRGDTAGTLARLAGCGADADLQALARDCLAADPSDRPADAGIVAARMTAYLAGVQQRLRAAELAHAAEAARAIEAEFKAAAERRARRLTAALAATILVAAALAGAGWRWTELKRIERARQATDRVNLALREATRLRGLSQGAAMGDLGPWAAAAAERAQDLLEPGIEPGLRRQVEELAAGLARERKQAEAAAEADRRDRRLLAALVDIRSAEADDYSGWGSDSSYAEAFRAAGYDVAGRPPAEVAAAIRARPPAVAVALAAAIDEWAAVRRSSKKDRAGAMALTALARAADPKAWRCGLRDALDLPDRTARIAALRKLADAAPFESLGPISLDLLGRALRDAGDPAASEAVLRRAQRRHPDDAWITYTLALALEALGRRAEAVRYFMAARALAPGLAHELAHALERLGEGEEAVAVFRELHRLRPDDGRHLVCLGFALKSQGQPDEATAILRRAEEALAAVIRLRPDDAPAHSNLGRALYFQGRVDEAIAEVRRAIRLDPENVMAHGVLGDAMLRQGKLDEAIAEREKVIRLSPHNSMDHYRLGRVLQIRGKVDEAIAAYREAIRLQPDYAYAHSNLGSMLLSQGKLDEAIAEHRTALRLDPDFPNIPNNLAWVLAMFPGRPAGDYDEAAVLARRAIDLQPQNGGDYNTLALAEYRRGRWGEAIAAAERSIELLRPGVDAGNWFFLAMAHARRGEADLARGFFDRAVAWTREHDPRNA